MNTPPVPKGDRLPDRETCRERIPARTTGPARWIGSLGALILLGSGLARGGPEREQVIDLEKGWNAVHLEVHPGDARPAAVFENTPVDIVARYFRLVNSVEFIADPSDEPWKREGWGVWYAPDREDAFLTSLHAIQGNQTYLVHAREAFRWEVSGEVRHIRRAWRSDSFNLVGFGVDPQNPPTFARLFEGAEGKIGQKIYRLQNGKWTKVLSPAGTTVRSGEAFWTYCSGRTDFQGPLDLKVPGTGTLDFGELPRRLSLEWTLSAPSPTGVSVEVVGAGPGAGPVLPLWRVERDLSTLSERQLPLASGPVDAADGPSAGRLSLMVRSEDLVADEQGALLKFSDGAGSVVWVPVTATRSSE